MITLKNNEGVIMIIESSQIEQEAHTKNYFEVNVTSSFEFRQTLLGLVNAKEGEDATVEETKSMTESEIIQEEMNKLRVKIASMFLEMILARFLGAGNQDDSELKNALNEYKQLSEYEPSTQVEMPKLMLAKTEVKVERTTEIIKEDTVDFSSKGIIKTSDKEFEIDLNISYTQEFYEKHKDRVEFSSVDFIDPLIIQYGKDSKALDFLEDEMSFKFDINADGKDDDIPMLKQGNGFLAFDKNGNGAIDDGTELFGPNTNNGFEELRALDSDGNGWIDEADPIFDDLKVWSVDENGQETLMALGQTGVGAIFLEDVSTKMMVSKTATDPLAHLKSTSMFVREDGSAGLLSSLDFIA
jgi:hypothetical protein